MMVTDGVGVGIREAKATERNGIKDCQVGDKKDWQVVKRETDRKNQEKSVVV